MAPLPSPTAEIGSRIVGSRIGIRRNGIYRSSHADQITLVLQVTKSMAKKLDPAPGHGASVHADSAHAHADLPGPVSHENAEHYRWGTNCDAWFMVKDKHLTVIEEFMPPGAPEVPHYHQKAQQFSYILASDT